ncbi:LacI family DNA-binding transcriptional regulator [Mucilaginibacter sp. HMF5004]|uniref:LacI family DNA-binding transcriptional regulator n=1 Tax=Mucilaginibacter rivuli TaxID=2857527 RepID=UPI001C5EB136|nr:helix-turn-helix domain-containing protein [Mucilaginibacter rivuli]MBW4888520.1 LacI family DNA-binding transcriptional regulator [Mucilaginibacter rivuli]
MVIIMAYKTVTIKQIADQLQLTQGTISRALRDDPKVKPQTKVKVNNMARQLGYVVLERNINPVPFISPKAGKSGVTIYDIAEELNLSPSTVSRALNGIGKVSKTTAKNVFDVAMFLGYSVNDGARALRSLKVSSGQANTKKITIYDIADELGISPSTVSRAFIKNSGVAKQTQLRVLNAANKMGFTHHEGARKLRGCKIKV